MGRAVVVLVISGMLVGCAERIDVGLPVDLIAGEGWSVAQRQVLQDAAECWNLETGSQLRLTDARSATAAQQVPIEISDFVCGYANGLTNYVGDLDVQICSLDASSPERLLTVVRHELGHVLNIRDHADDSLAVMNEIGVEAKTKRFRPADRHLFHSANPEFEAADECQVARMIAESPSRPVIVTHPTHGTVVIWAAANGLEIHRPGKLPWPLVATIPSNGIAGWLRAVPTPGGLFITWAVGTVLRYAEVDLATGEIRSVGDLDIPAHDFDRDVDGLSMVLHGGDIYVGVTEEGVSVETTLYRIDGATRKRVLGTLLPDTWGNVHSVGGTLLFTARDWQGVVVSRLDPDGTAVETLVLEPPQQRDHLDSFGSQVVDGSLVVAHRRHSHPIALYRVKVGATLAKETASDVALPGEGGYTLASLAQGPDGLAVAVNRIDRGNFEVFVSLLDPASLALRKAWSRISAPDLTDSIQPWVARHGGRFIAVWRDFHDLASIELRGRCF